MNASPNIIAMPTAPWGATREDWQHFVDVLGLTRDLLPVVSNPRAQVSPDSTLSGVGKVPSVYNGSGYVVSIKDWTQRNASKAEISAWCNESDYGTCIQTRQVRAIDVDVTDQALADEIRAVLTGEIGALPCRTRPNSSKFLLAFTLKGDYTKRIIKTQHGNIEFLAGGQQFIAVGTHPSMVRYQWEGGLPDEFPKVDAKKFELVWEMLETLFGIAPSIDVRASTGPLVPREAPEEHDDITTYLLDQGWVKAIDRRSGRVDIRCPFESEHTSESGQSATSYFPSNVGGFERGHFKCQHAHCAHRNDGDFLHAVGFYAADFEEIVEQTPENPDYTPPPPPFERDVKGQIVCKIENVVLAVKDPTFVGVDVAFDTFRDEVMLTVHGAQQWRPFTDGDYVKLRIILERKGFKKVSAEAMRDAVNLLRDTRRFDSAILWSESLEWDGVCRCETFFLDYIAVDESESYAKAVSRYFWTALAGRVLDPGVKADMVPILVGEQGVKKSQSVAAIAPHADHFVEIDLAHRDDDLSRQLRGKLVCEIPELRGLHTKQIESIKAFVTRTHENWIPKFKEFSTTFPRRAVFVGTTNEKEFLADSTGNRRWLPMQVVACYPEKIVADRLQLWAEAMVMYRRHGILFQEAERIGRTVHEQYRVTDEWEGAIATWLNTPAFGSEAIPADEPYLLASDITERALGIPKGRQTKGDTMRVATAMKALGWEKMRRTVGGRQSKVWVRTDISDLL